MASDGIRKRMTASGEVRYQVRVRFDDASGKERTLSATCRTVKEAESKRREFLSRKERGVGLVASRQTVEEFGRDWVERGRTEGLSPLTTEHYRKELERFVYPVIGNVPLKLVRAEHVQMVLDAMAKRMNARTGEPLSQRTRLHVYRVLYNMLGQAKMLDVIEDNPAERVRPPRVEKRQVHALTAEQIEAVLEECEAESDALGIAALLAVTCGMRRGEICGLRWEHVDLGADETAEGGPRPASLRIVETVVSVRGKGLLTKSPKSRESVRSLPLPARTVQALRAYRVNQNERRLSLGPVWQKLGLVVDNGKGGYYHPDKLSGDFTAAAKRAEVPATLHTMRHQYASLLVAAGENIKVVQAVMGHASAQITMDTYSHLLPDANRSVAGRIDEALSRKKAATS